MVGASGAGQAGKVSTTGLVFNASANVLTIGGGAGGNITGCNVISATTLIGNLSNGNSNITISTNSNINLTAVGNLTTVITGTGVNIFGNLSTTGNNTTTGNISANNITSDRNIIRKVGNVTASGTTIANTATTLGAYDINMVTSVSGSNAVILPQGPVGAVFYVTNIGNSTLSIFPPATGKINTLAANASVTAAANTSRQLWCSNSLQWWSGVI